MSLIEYDLFRLERKQNVFRLQICMNNLAKSVNIIQSN